jgi:hypothetical protein
MICERFRFKPDGLEIIKESFGQPETVVFVATFL